MPAVPQRTDDHSGSAWRVFLATFMGILGVSIAVFVIFFVRRRRGASQPAAAPGEQYKSRSTGQSMDRLLDRETPSSHGHTASTSDTSDHHSSSTTPLLNGQTSPRPTVPRLTIPPDEDNTMAESAVFPACMDSATSAYSQTSATSSALVAHFPLPPSAPPTPDAVVFRALHAYPKRTPHPIQHPTAKHTSVHVVRMLPSITEAPVGSRAPATGTYQRTTKLSTASQISADVDAFMATLPVYTPKRQNSVGVKAMPWPETPGVQAYGLDRVEESP